MFRFIKQSAKSTIFLTSLAFMAVPVHASYFSKVYDGVNYEIYPSTTTDNNLYGYAVVTGPTDDCQEVTGGHLLLLDSISTDANTYPVKVLKATAFKGCDWITSLKLPEHLKNIEDGVFMECSGITGPLELPTTLETIGRSAFQGCTGLTGPLVVPNSVISIGGGAFSGCCNISSLKLSESIERIGVNCFNNCQSMAGELVIPEGVKTVYEGAFNGCSSIESITFPGSLEYIYRDSFEKMPGVKRMIFQDGDALLTITQNSFTNFPLEYLYIGREFIMNYSYWQYKRSGIRKIEFGPNLKVVPSDIASGCKNLVEVTIPESVRKIGGNAFYNSGLKSIKLPASLEEIGGRTFQQCYGLTSVEIPENVKSFGEDAFYDCTSLYDMTLRGSVPPSITAGLVSDWAFESMRCYVPEGALNSYRNSDWSKFKHLVSSRSLSLDLNLPAPGTLFEMLDLESVNNVTSVKLSGKLNGTDLLALNKLTNICSLDMSDATIVSGGMPYYEADNQRYGTTDNVLGPRWAYGLTGISELKLPDNLEAIEGGAFDTMYGLRRIHIPSSLKRIGYDAFYNCKAIEAVMIDDIKHWCMGISFEGLGSNPLSFAGKLYLNGSLVTGLDVLGPDVTTISKYAFVGYRSLESIVIPPTVKAIYEGAFEHCGEYDCLSVPFDSEEIFIKNFAFDRTSFRKVELDRKVGGFRLKALSESLEAAEFGPGVDEIPDGMCEDCKKLTSVVISNPVKKIGTHAFSGCTSLESISIPNSVAAIGNGAFMNCKSLTDVRLPESLSAVSSNLFDYCEALRSVYVPERVTSIGYRAFDDCKALEQLNIPRHLEAIGEDAFYNCSALKSADLPETLRSIGKGAFYNCQGLTEMNIPSGVTEIPEHSLMFTSLKELTLPGSVRSIGKYALYIKTLDSLSVINPIPAAIDEQAFAPENYQNTVLCVPAESKMLYWIHPLWSAFTNLTTWSADEESRFDDQGFAFNVTSERNAVAEVAGVQAAVGRAASVAIPGSVVHNGRRYTVDGIANGAFKNSSVVSVDIPASIVYVGHNAFAGCASLRTISICAATPPSAVATSFDDNHYSDVLLNLPFGSESLYAGDDVWGRFANTMGFDDVEMTEADASGDASVEIFNLEGVCIHRGPLDATVLQPGIYIVRTATATRKLHVR